MKQILSTLNVFLRQEWITGLVISIATAFFMFLIFRVTTLSNGVELKTPPNAALILIAMLSVFVGIYLGGGFLRLRQSCLWRFDTVYRSNLIKSLICAALAYGLIQYFPLVYVGWSWYLSILAPACVTLLSAQILIANHWAMKLILPAVPFILFQLTKYEIDSDMILLLLITSTFFALFLNSVNRNRVDDATAGLLSGNVKRQMSSMGMQTLNKISIGILSTFKIGTKPKDFSIALLQPASRYGFGSTVITVLCPILIFSINSSKLSVEVFATMVLGSMMLVQFMDLSLLAPQTKPVSHLFSSNEHYLFKREILSMIHKHTAIHASLTVFTLVFLSLVIDGFSDIGLLIRMGVTILIVAITFSPIMMTLSWFKINIKLFAVLGTYALVGFIFCRWQFQHDLTDMLSFQVLGAVLILLVIRFVSVYLWKRQTVEEFMKVHG